MQTIYDLQMNLNNRILQEKFGYTVQDMNEEQRKQWVLNFCRATNHEFWELEESVLKEDEHNTVVEIVDLVHFLVSIGQVLDLKLDMRFNFYYHDGSKTFWLKNITETIHDCQKYLNDIEECFGWRWWGTKTNDFIKASKIFYNLLWNFSILISYLGVDEQQLFEVYCQKNKINHERQDNGYNLDTKTEDDNKTIKIGGNLYRRR